MNKTQALLKKAADGNLDLLELLDAQHSDKYGVGVGTIYEQDDFSCYFISNGVDPATDRELAKDEAEALLESWLGEPGDGTIKSA